MNFIPARRWNRQYIEPHAECVALPGARTRISHSIFGQVVDLVGTALWQHPWFTSPQWSAKNGCWETTVNAGFVNGLDPSVPGVENEDGSPADLIDNPSIPLHAFRAGLEDSNAVAKTFFMALGVRELEDKIKITELGVTIESTEDANPLPPRALRAVDLYLAVARATYESTATAVDASGTSGLVIDYSVAYDTANLDRVGPRARLQQSAVFPAVRVPTFAERLLGTFQDDGEDRQLISTVFLLSPPNVDGEPDGSWTPYVQHNAFWNFVHAARNIPPVLKKTTLRIHTGLAAGFGDLISNQILSGINEAADVVQAAMNTTDNAGRFWSI